jgi:signal transduction histidine kinase
MTILYSLRFRIVAAFVIFAFLLGLLYAGFLYGSVHWSEDLIQQKRLQVEAEDFIEAYSKDSATPLLNTRYIRSGWGVDAFEPELRPYLAELPLGITEFNLDAFEAQVAKYLVEGNEKPLLIIYEVSEFEPLEAFTGLFFFFLLIGLFIVTASGWLLGIMTAQRVISPVVSLANQVAKVGPNNLATEFHVAYADDEVGVLARTLADANRRLADFVHRERQFTSNASHELRTPVTVVKGAAELIRSLTQDTKVLAPLKRIDRGVKDMEHLIDTFLTLAREGSLITPDVPIDLETLAQTVVTESQHLLEEKDIQVDWQVKAKLAVLAPEPVLSIVLGNLLRNAFLYTKKGSVNILLDAEKLQIDDTGPGFPENRIADDGTPLTVGHQAEGHGLGLGIVSDFCRRYGWRLELANREPNGSSVRVIFCPD